MKKRYGLESIIGKNSSLRFPRLVSIDAPTTINCILPANTEEIESSFNTALTMKSADPVEAYDQFNTISCDYDEEFPIRVKVTIQGPISFTEVLDPTIFSLFYIAFDLNDFAIEKFRASITDILLVSTNFALIKDKPENSYFMSDLITNMRTILSNIKSFNCGRKRLKTTNILHMNIRLQQYLLNIKSHVNKLQYRKRLYHFCYKALKYQKKDLIPLFFDRIEYYYDIFEDWDDAYDFAWLDHYLLLWDDLFELSLLAEEFSYLEKHLIQDIMTPADYYLQLSFNRTVEQLTSVPKLDLLKTFKISSNQL